jgi:hypothetical protein
LTACGGVYFRSSEEMNEEMKKAWILIVEIAKLWAAAAAG